MARLNYSRQRESIKNYVMSRHDHPTAEQVYEAVKKEYPSVSRGTIYRNLSLLADRGEIVKLSRDGDVERFDGNTQPHYHFVCKECGCVTDLTMPWLDHVDVLAANDFDGDIEGHTIWFYGTCRECREKNKNKN